MPTAKDGRSDDRRRAYLRMYLEVEDRILLKGEYLVWDLKSCRTASAPVLELEAVDLVHYGWRLLLEREPDFADTEEFLFFFFRRMENHCKEVSRRCLEASMRSVSFDGQESGVEIPEVTVISLDDYRDRESQLERASRVALIRQKLQAEPELLALFDLMIVHGILEARNQATHLKIDVREVYRRRDKLKAFIRRNVDPDA